MFKSLHYPIGRRLADRLFSKIIRQRDHYTCVRCHTVHASNSKGLHVSHYFSRAREETRFDFRNADSLCLACHFMWAHGDGRREYIKFKVKQLGKEQMNKLYRLAIAPPPWQPCEKRFRTDALTNSFDEDGSIKEL